MRKRKSQKRSKTSAGKYPQKPGASEQKQQASAELKTAWLKQLYTHHAWIIEKHLSYSPYASRLKPLIDLMHDKSRWGFWDPEKNLIGLNYNMILTCPWSTVTGILLHETAHQLVSVLEPHQSSREGPHGPTFQKYCELLHLDPVFRHPGTDEMTAKYPPSPFGPRTENQEHPLLVKIQKLLALGDSPEPAEAQSALAMAGRLMAKHNIELPKADQKAGFDSYERRLILLNSTQISSRVRIIASILNRHFFVKSILCYLYNPQLNRTERTLEVMGRPVNLVMAEHVFHFLMERTETLWQYHKPLALAAGEKGLGAKNSFICSLLNAFYTKLDEAETESRVRDGLESSDVILGSDTLLQDYYSLCYPTARSTYSRSPSSFSPFSQKAGTEAGRNLSISQPIGDTGGGSRGLNGYLE
ncbi:MAG: DUF2786 domain-containing protein [Deltaproteobacteria bacterium]|jgi:hypothetical protein|nr:DUF2786 domain-containing protein [Deltaproteobacteria bacterium]